MFCVALARIFLQWTCAKDMESKSNPQQLILDVMDGNPGALTIIDRLMAFPRWSQLLQHLRNCGLIGSTLWQVVQDEYGQDWLQFARDQQAQLELSTALHGVQQLPSYTTPHITRDPRHRVLE
jgi:hypothetical protein